MADGAYYDRDLSLEVWVEQDENPPVVELRMPSMATLTPDAARRFGRAIVAAADIAERGAAHVQREEKV